MSFLEAMVPAIIECKAFLDCEVLCELFGFLSKNLIRNFSISTFLLPKPDA
jgi:hypothetical protein